jgi:type IV pilus assembly protein PilX
MNKVNRMYNQSQRGAALIVALIMLLLMAIVSVSSIQDVGLQEKMAGNMRDTQTALMAGEIAVSYAESGIRSLSSKPAGEAYSDCDGCKIIESSAGDANASESILTSGDSNKISTWESKAITYANRAFFNVEAESIATSYSQPEFLVEYIQADSSYEAEDVFSGEGISMSGKSSTPDSNNVGEDNPSMDHRYKITALVRGASAQSQAILQTEYVQRFD